jgi:hypothetical protein
LWTCPLRKLGHAVVILLFTLAQLLDIFAILL